MEDSEFKGTAVNVTGGAAVTNVALDLGYDSTSAFIAMFRRSLGVPPGHYFQ